MQNSPGAGKNPDMPPEIETDEAVVAAINEQLNEARFLIHADRRDEALQLCLKILQQGSVPLQCAATLSGMMRDLGQIAAAEQIRQLVIDGIKKLLPSIWNSFTALLSLSDAMADVNAVEEAEMMCRRASELEPGEFTAIVSLVALLSRQKREDEAIKLADSFLETAPDPFPFFIHLVKLADHMNSQALVEHFLESAKTLCKTHTQRTQLEPLVASVGKASRELNQQRFTAKLFDEFAHSYDQKMAQLNNNGPKLVHVTLEELALDKDQTRRVLDAGCGTGLCAEFLRAYANEIVGADVSIKMLEKSLEKGVYDTLVRTDLSKLATYPEGKFDMIVSADVLVYFGALDTVFSNLHAKLNPGAWFLFTVECASDNTTTSGYDMHASGRYKHSDEYLKETLRGAGFSKPKLFNHGHLRNEFGAPVVATVVAVQKPGPKT